MNLINFLKNGKENYIDKVSNLNEDSDVNHLQLWTGTSEQYNNLMELDKNTIYLVQEEIVDDYLVVSKDSLVFSSSQPQEITITASNGLNWEIV